MSAIPATLPHPTPEQSEPKIKDFGEGQMQAVVMTHGGRSWQAVHYVGEFRTGRLRAKAESGLWYCRPLSTFCDLVVTGEGITPQAAFEDMRNRALEKVNRAALIHCL